MAARVLAVVVAVVFFLEWGVLTVQVVVRLVWGADQVAVAVLTTITLFNEVVVVVQQELLVGTLVTQVLLRLVVLAAAVGGLLGADHLTQMVGFWVGLVVPLLSLTEMHTRYPIAAQYMEAHDGNYLCISGIYL
jgi:hypothetical protein